MTIDINKNSALIDPASSGYSGCGCGNRRYYTKAEIDEMLKDVLDPEKVKEILDEMFEDYIEGGELEQLIINAIAGLYTNEEIDDMLEELEARMKIWTGGQGYLKDITLTINGTRLHNNGSIVIEGGDVSNKLDITAFTQAMENETARTENTYLKDITITINGTPLHNNGEIIIEGGGGEPVDISGKLDTSAFTAYTSSTETWENKMEDCCDEVKTYIDYLQYVVEDLQRQIDELKPEPGPTPTPTGDTFTLTAVYNVTSTTEPTKIINNPTEVSGATNVLCIDKFFYNGIEHSGNTFVFPATGEQTVQIHFIESVIPKWCFFETQLKRITIPNGITLIDTKALALTKITNITIPDSVTEIGNEALEFSLGGSNNYEIHIGSGLQRIGSYINPKYRGTQNIYFTSTTPPTFTGGSSAFNKAGVTLSIYVPSSAVQAYKTAPGFTDVADKIQGI